METNFTTHIVGGSPCQFGVWAYPLVKITILHRYCKNHRARWAIFFAIHSNTNSITWIYFRNFHKHKTYVLPRLPIFLLDMPFFENVENNRKNRQTRYFNISFINVSWVRKTMSFRCILLDHSFFRDKSTLTWDGAFSLYHIHRDVKSIFIPFHPQVGPPQNREAIPSPSHMLPWPRCSKQDPSEPNSEKMGWNSGMSRKCVCVCVFVVCCECVCVCVLWVCIYIVYYV